MCTLEQMSFHEATVLEFYQYENALKLELEGVLVGDVRAGVSINATAVASVMVDGKLLDAPLMECDDGEVLSLDISEGELSLLIEWNDFHAGKSFTRSYKILAGNVSIVVV